MPPDDPTAQSMRLPDGRSLAYAEYGTPAGVPALFFHGAPGSRLSAALLAPAAQAGGVRLIGVDRPGSGLSEPQSERTRQDWPRDVEALADALGLDRFAVLGWSAGGPYALACGALIPHRLTMVGILAGIGPLGRFRPATMRNLLRVRLDSDTNRMADSLAATWTRTRDAAATKVEAAQEAAVAVAAGIREGVRQNPAAAMHELRLLARGWDFDPAAVTGVPVRFWHGKADAMVPAWQTRMLAAEIPEAQATYIPAAGHVSLLTEHGAEILREVRRFAWSTD